VRRRISTRLSITPIPCIPAHSRRGRGVINSAIGTAGELAAEQNSAGSRESRGGWRFPQPTACVPPHGGLADSRCIENPRKLLGPDLPGAAARSAAAADSCRLGDQHRGEEIQPTRGPPGQGSNPALLPPAQQLNQAWPAKQTVCVHTPGSVPGGRAHGATSCAVLARWRLIQHLNRRRNPRSVPCRRTLDWLRLPPSVRRKWICTRHSRLLGLRGKTKVHTSAEGLSSSRKGGTAGADCFSSESIFVKEPALAEGKPVVPGRSALAGSTLPPPNVPNKLSKSSRLVSRRALESPRPLRRQHAFTQRRNATSPDDQVLRLHGRSSQQYCKSAYAGKPEGLSRASAGMDWTERVRRLHGSFGWSCFHLRVLTCRRQGCEPRILCGTWRLGRRGPGCPVADAANRSQPCAAAQ